MNSTKRSTASRPAPWLETLRLSLREFTPADSDDLLRLNRDPRVMRFVGDGKPVSLERHAEILRRVLGYARHYADLGFWYTTRRDTGAFVGWFALGEVVGPAQWLACLLITLAILLTPARATRNLTMQIVLPGRKQKP